MRTIIQVVHKSIFFTLVGLLIIVFGLQPMAIYAESSDEMQAIFRNTPFYDPNSTDCGSTSTSSGQNMLIGKKVFFIGDSLTVGTTQNGLLDIVSKEGMSVDTYYQNTNKKALFGRVYGKSVEATSGSKVSDAIDRLKDHEQDFATGAADVIVVGLGSNRESNLDSAVKTMIDYLRSKNTGLTDSKNIMWVNTNVTSTDFQPPTATVNSGLAAAATKYNFTILDIASIASANPDDGYGVHYTDAGYIARSQTIIDLMKKVHSPSDYQDNEKLVWDFLVNKKHLTLNAAAGVMGNLYAESGMNPRNMQAGTPNREEPEMPSEKDPTTGLLFPLTAIYGRYGYGIVQWTIKDRQLNFLRTSLGGGVAPFDKARSTGDLEYQLDYMWYELETTVFDDVLAVLEDPNVTLNDASDYFATHFEAPRSIGGVQAPKPPAPPETPEETAARLAQNAITKQEALTKRRGFSETMLQKYQSSTYTSPQSDCGQLDAAAGGLLGGNGKVDALTGYAFPLEPQTRAVGGITVNQTTPTHGSRISPDGKSPAFDLFGLKANAGGDDIYAFDDGEIAGVGEDEPGWCYNIQLKAADGFYYWYGHLNNVVVERGDHVDAGQVMGETAEWTAEHNCNGSSGAGHLHIDRGCTLNNVPQTGGRDGCRDPDFIPLLSQIYGRL